MKSRSTVVEERAGMGQRHSKVRGGGPHAKAALQWGRVTSGMLGG